MTGKLNRFALILPLVASGFAFAAPAAALSVEGAAVDAAESTFGVGGLSNGKIEYFIPLSSDHTGTYGVGTVPCGTTGECSDSGSGQGYGTADALTMNLYFDLSGQSQSAAATLSFHFDDLDLDPVNDPEGFHESILLSYWDVDSDSYAGVGGVIDETAELTAGVFGGGAATTTPGTLDDPSDDPFSWHLDLGALGLLADLNASVAELGGFWVRLGFGSEYLDSHGNPRHGRNTAEFLTADLKVSPVPVPSAVWLFGSALLGFIGMSRRTRV